MVVEVGVTRGGVGVDALATGAVDGAVGAENQLSGIARAGRAIGVDLYADREVSIRRSLG